MSYNLAPEAAPWFEHLADSVGALRAAAHEWRLAHQGATLALAHADVGRAILHEGKVTGQPGPEATGWYAKVSTRTVHSTAVFAVRRLHWDATTRTRAEYEYAALLYASGAAWAIRAVRAQEQPARVVFGVADTERHELVPGSLDAGFDAFKDDRYSNAGELEAAHDRLQSCLYARDAAEDIGSQEYVSDHEASEIAELERIAEDIADAAWAYGGLLREGLGFVLLGPRAARRRELAEQRAAQEQTETPGGDR